MFDTRFQTAIAKIDAANAADPNSMMVEGVARPLEVVHAERRTYWVEQLLGAEASEALHLAARGQHLRRWEIPRDKYPRTREAYLAWRNELKKFHAAETGNIMAEVGYEADLIERVQSLIMKKRLKLDPEVQALEDALCLVFLETQFTDFAQKEQDKIINIVQKTWRKMSPQGQAFALELPLTEADAAIIGAALGG